MRNRRKKRLGLGRKAMRMEVERKPVRAREELNLLKQE